MKSKRNVMIVEDDLNIAREMKFLLMGLNYQVTSISRNGEDALFKLETEKPDVVLMDIELEGELDGIETAIRIHDKFDVPVIFSTSHAEGTTIDRAKEAKPYGYIVKPARESDLQATIEIACYKFLIEKIIQEKDELLHSVINTSPDLIFVKDESGRYILVNQVMAEVYGTTVDEMINKTDIELADLGIMDKNKVSAFIEADQQVRDTKQSIFIPEEEIIFPDGRQIWIQTRKIPLTIYDNSNHILGLVENITELKNTELELSSHREHLRLINKILRHDLTNDLAIIQSSIKLFEKHGEERYLKDATRFISKSANLINRMRDLEKFISSHRGLRLYNIKELVDNVIKDYKDVDISVCGNCKVLANDSLSSVIDNIIRNAIVHGKTKTIDINIFDRKEKCFIQIADQGIGIPDDIKDKIFEENFKYGETGQTGIGLYIVKKSIQQLGGNVFVENNKPKGSIFTISLKLVKER